VTDDAVRERVPVAAVPAAPPPRLVDQEEARLMRALAAGDRHASEALVTRHLARIVAFADRMLGDGAEAEDVAQEAFTRLWQQASRWDPARARVATWLHRVASNLCIDRLRRRRTEPLDDATGTPDGGAGPAARASATELGAHVRAALAALPERQRTAVTLCHYQGMRQDEAAHVLDVSIDALESLLARGRRAMRERLRDVAADLLGDDR
jgi:RNA polymerase sigma factor (sigma-70 family)